MDEKTQYLALTSEIIAKQAVILGPDIAILKARSVGGLTVSDDGKVTDIGGNPKMVLQELYTLMQLIWHQGVVADYRRQFWRQLWGVYRRNPSRMKKYLGLCVRGEHYFHLRERIIK